MEVYTPFKCLYRPGEKRRVTGLRYMHGVLCIAEESYCACSGRVPQPSKQKWPYAQGIH